MKSLLIFILILFLCKNGYSQHASIQGQLKALFDEKDNTKLKSALKAYEESNEESGLIVVVNYYNYKNLKSTADSLKRVAAVKFPQGDLAYSNALEKFESLQSYKDKIAFQRQLLKRFSGRDFSRLNGMLVLEAIENRDCITATSTFAKITDTSYIHYLIPNICEKLMLSKETNDECMNAFLISLLDQYKHMLKGIMISENAPNLTLEDLDGKLVSLEQLRGKTIILDFWATWCKPCIQSFPGMHTALNSYKNDPNIVFLFVNTAERGNEDHKHAVKKLMEDNGYNFRVLMDKKDEVSKRFRALEAFKVAALPTKYIIDKNGLIRFKLSGANGGSNFIQEEIKIMINAINE